MVEPFAPKVPVPGSMVHESVWVEVQVNVDESPAGMLSGLALMVTVGGG